MNLYDWQAECLDAWAKNQFRGIVNVATGAGKTVLAIAAVPALEKTVGEVSVKIIVPQTFLVRQWYGALTSAAGISRNDIGVYSGSHKSGPGKKYMIYVINSARYSFARHMLEDHSNQVFIIADECHHYGAEENSRIFDFVKLSACPGRYYTLGLSATPYSKHFNDVLVPFLGNEIYRFDFIDALNAGILSGFSLLNISIHFSPDERGEYEELTNKLSVSLRRLREHCPELYMHNSGSFFARLESIAKGHALPEIRELASMVSVLAFTRKETVHMARERIECVTALVKLLGESPKIIIFGERIETADAIYGEIEQIMPGEAGVYHSGVHESVRKVKLRDFEDGRLRILVSCKTLDEGLNVSDADVGIVVSSTSAERQRIQRLGRILRKKDRQARFFYLYVKETMEAEEVFSDITGRLRDTVPIVDLEYSEGNFVNDYYKTIAEEAASEAVYKGWGADKIAEFERNVRLGSVCVDWLADEPACRNEIASSSALRRRNYYSAMLMLIKARGRLEKL
jgi:superfamily II DNA or RNA helicase